jgi:hypothetical protein
MSYANGETHRYWTPDGWPVPSAFFYWPANTPNTLEGWTTIFTRQGYEVIDSQDAHLYDVELGFEKVAIYVDLTDMVPSHVAISDGQTWKSKLGEDYDIEHISLDLLEGQQKDEYGIVAQVLKRSSKNENENNA